MQAKLTISEPGDQYEQEADRVAETVMRMPEPIGSEGVTVSGQVKDVHTQPVSSADAEHLHRQTMDEEMPEEEEETLQAKEVSGETPEVTPELEVRLTSARGSGQPLPESVRAFFEPRFGYDFGGVRVHTDGQAVDSARSVKARAYTLGQDIVFGSGQYAPETPSGKQLLAHELTHVVQQSGADGHLIDKNYKRCDLSSISAARSENPGASVIKRACGETQIGEAEIEPDGVYKDLGDPGVEGTLVRYRVGCDEFLTPEDEARLRGLAGRLPWRTRIVIHGFASEEGRPTFNQMLSLARAAKARAILSGLMDPAQIERVIWHGSVPGNRADRRSVIIQTESPLPPVTKTLTIVSWINGADLPSFSRFALLNAPGDLVAQLAACMALGCTANTPPPASLPSSALSAFIGSKQYRGLQNYTLTYFPSTSGRGEFLSRQIVGYTAPSSCGPIPPSTFQLGEASPLNYATTDMSGKNPGADALMKFRVSSAEESSAIEEATSFPGSLLFSRATLRRVPWVWTQTRLRIDASTGLLHWQVHGSEFPTHTIYLDGVRVGDIPQGPCRVVVASRFRTADMPRQTMEEEARQARVPIGQQEETVESGGTSSGAG